MSAFSRSVGPVRGVVVCLGHRNRRQAHFGELRPDKASRTIREFFRWTGGEELIPVRLVMNPWIGVEHDARFVHTNQGEELVTNLIARYLAELAALVVENDDLLDSEDPGRILSFLIIRQPRLRRTEAHGILFVISDLHDVDGIPFIDERSERAPGSHEVIARTG